MLRAEEDLTGPFRNEFGRAVLRPERRSRYEVVYLALPGEEGEEMDVYETVTEAKVQLEDLEEARWRRLLAATVPCGSQQRVRRTQGLAQRHPHLFAGVRVDCGLPSTLPFTI